jgi:N-terminal 7TM region of histidine kinase
MYDLLTHSLRALNSFLTAGIAITAFSLLLYALSFNLRDRVARTFAFILVCVVIVFVGEAFSSVAKTPEELEFWQRVQWVGIIFLPAAYMHLSDALLSTTGRPSRGRRRLFVLLMYLAGLGFLIILPTDLLVGPLIQNVEPAPHLQRTWLTWIFTGFYAVAMLLSWMNFWRAYQRTVTSATRRRMTYLLIGALAPALGSYPYLLFGSEFAEHFPLIFWFTVTLSNLFVTFLLILMAYGVAFFGVPWPDRVVKRRLFKWIMRGPVTASTVLVITTLLRRLGNLLALDLSAVIPVFMAGSILLLEHLITLVAPVWERRLFFGKDRAEMELLQTLDERLLTLGDLQQFLEAILAAVCDRLQVSRAFIATLGAQGIETLIMIGGDNSLEEGELPVSMIQAAAQNGRERVLFAWGDHWLVPLSDQAGGVNELIGLLGVARKPDQDLDDEQLDALHILARRAALAIRDRYRQEQVFSSLEELTPQMEWIQRLRAASRYDGTQILTTPDFSLGQSELSPMVKDALTHYWGGPKLTGSPLLNLQVVQKIAKEHEETSTNALRTLLRNAIDHVRPEGERRFTAEWILYNILELKFMEGRKVREVAMRLAMSEADLYRKQRVAIEAVAKAILEMEQEARREISAGIEPNTDTIHQANEFARGGKF